MVQKVATTLVLEDVGTPLGRGGWAAVGLSEADKYVRWYSSCFKTPHLFFALFVLLYNFLSMLTNASSFFQASNICYSPRDPRRGRRVRGRLPPERAAPRQRQWERGTVLGRFQAGEYGPRVSRTQL